MFMRIGVLAVITLLTAGCSKKACDCVTADGTTKLVPNPSGLSCQSKADLEPDFLRCSDAGADDIMAPFGDYDLEVSTGAATSEAGWYRWDELVMLGS